MMFNDVPIVSRYRDQWYTPHWVIECARTAFGGDIDLDPASCAEANKIVGAKHFIAPPDDGLLHNWTGNVWINPPFSESQTSQFVDKALDSACRWIMLTMASGTSKWFLKLWQNPSISVCIFKKSEIKFYRPGLSTVSEIYSLIGIWSNLPAAELEHGFNRRAR